MNKNKAGYRITARRDKRVPVWVSGSVGGYAYEASVYDEPSRFGINEGRVSKLWVWTADRQDELLAYDRGWDKEPSEAHRELYEALLNHLETLPPLSD